MKNLVLAIALILSFNICAQNELVNTKLFVRVYDVQGKKIAKGKIHSISETALLLKSKEGPIEIPLSAIGTIKTKRAAGNNVLTGAAIGATTVAIFGVATSNDGEFLSWSAEDGAMGGALAGGIIGTVIGGITIPFKNSKSYEIDGDKTRWKAFKEMILNN